MKRRDASRSARLRDSPWRALLVLSLGCAAPAASLPPPPPLWHDPDRGPFAAELEPYYSPPDWDRVEKTFLLPVLNLLSVRTSSDAVNVNVLDEVPDSSWFENRVSRFPLSKAQASRGPCEATPSAERGPWRIVSARPGGASPGFVFVAPGGEHYLAKFDGTSGNARATVADVLGSRIYHAAGYHVPCNSIVHFDAARLVIDAAALAENAAGAQVPLGARHVERILAKALRRADGRYRALVSRFLPGRPLGPWRYHGLRRGDRNDVVPHEDRRELRGSRLLAAWIDHVDQVEGNTLAMWREAGNGRGYLVHHLLDFGDCFGSLPAVSAQEAWRHGRDYWIAPATILVDWLTLGAVERPWDRAELGPLGLLLGYYDVESFEPEAWKPRYPNPAFMRMTERDAAWMARIIARLEPELLAAMLEPAMAPRPLHDELLRVLLGRRRKLLERYLARLSPLADPALRPTAGGSALCAVDLAVRSGVAAPRAYRARTRPASGSGVEPLEVRARGADVCVRLPAAPREPERAMLLEVEVGVLGPGPAPIRYRLYAPGSGGWQLASIEREEP